MYKKPQFIVRNTKSTSHTRNQTRRQSFSQTQRMIATIEQFGNQEHSMTPDERVNRLQGNLKVLEKKYRQNLKQGFDNKIKAYRLQAVVDRKMIQQAIELTNQEQEMERLQEKIQFNERMKRLNQERALLSSYQRQERQQYIKQRNESQKRKMSLTLYERNKSIQQHQKQVHDRIVYEQLNSNRKKIFFQEIRKIGQKRELFQSKRQLLERVIANTQKLKQLKMILRSFQEGSLQQETFLTL